MTRVRKKTHIRLRNACACVHTSNKIPTRLQHKKKHGKGVLSGLKRRLEEIARTHIIELDFYEGKEKLGNDVAYFYYAGVC